MNNPEHQNPEQTVKIPSMTRRLAGVGMALGIAIGPTAVASTSLGGEMGAIVDILDTSEASAQAPPITCDSPQLKVVYLGDFNGDGSKYGDANTAEWTCKFINPPPPPTLLPSPTTTLPATQPPTTHAPTTTKAPTTTIKAPITTTTEAPPTTVILTTTEAPTTTAEVTTTLKPTTTTEVPTSSEYIYYPSTCR